MKATKIFTFVLFFVFSEAHTQDVKVIGSASGEPVFGVSVHTPNQKKMVMGNRSGVADLSGFEANDTLIFRHTAYHPVTTLKKDIKEGVIRLESKTFIMRDVSVTVSKWEQNQDEIPQQILSITPDDVARVNPQTTADLLDQTGQVFVQKSQLGGGSPMIRGFAANRVLIMVDGVRMNNAIYRSGNLQNVISIDPNLIGEAEVIYGPGSVIYGSDALGGVMDFHTREPKFSSSDKTTLNAMVFTRYSTANNERTGHADVNIGTRKFASFSSVTFSDFNNLRAGSNRPEGYPDFGKRTFYVERIDGEDQVIANDDPNLQVPSGYRQLNLLQKFAVRPTDWWQVEYAFHYSTTSDIPRYDRLIVTEDDGSPDKAEWNYGPQRWSMNWLNSAFYNENFWYDEAKITLAYQDVQESRIDRNFNNPRRRNRTEDVDVFSVNADLDKQINENQQLFYGLEYVGNRVNSNAFRENINTGEKEPTATRYPDKGSTWQSAAAYLGYKWRTSDKTVVNAGARYTNIWINSQFSDQFYDFPFDEIDINSGAFSGSLGLVHTPVNFLKLDMMVSSGFRAPNIDDVGKVFDSEPGNVVVPNSNLRPEYVYNAETGARVQLLNNRLTLGASGFYTLLNNAMVRRNFRFNGQDSIAYDGELSRVQALVNVGSAYIWGYHFSVQAQLNPWLVLNSTVTNTYGRDREENIPLRHTAPLFGQTTLSYSHSNLQAEFYVRYNGARPFSELSPSEQNKTFLYTDNGTLSWTTLNLRASYELGEKFLISTALENILDLHYRPYSSGISAPGRNLIISLRATL